MTNWQFPKIPNEYVCPLPELKTLVSAYNLWPLSFGFILDSWGSFMLEKKYIIYSPHSSATGRMCDQIDYLVKYSWFEIRVFILLDLLPNHYWKTKRKKTKKQKNPKKKTAIQNWEGKQLYARFSERYYRKQSRSVYEIRSPGRFSWMIAITPNASKCTWHYVGNGLRILENNALFFVFLHVCVCVWGGVFMCKSILVYAGMYVQCSILTF